MIIKRLEDVIGTDRHVTGSTGTESRRLLLAADGLGYSLHHTIVPEGTEQHLHYKHHTESNYCIAGEGEVLDVATGVTHPIKPGTLYTLDKHDEHVLRATNGNMHLICIFVPALVGNEKHQSDGSYPPPD
ncbi:ectoine synthase [Rhodoligotrophos appendicifer]|nr:ectoine synthase [Rhodoligotrophos appendicifer]